MLDQVIDRLAPQVAGMALNANGDAARFDGLGLPVLPDSIDGFAGPLAGVLAGLDWAAEQGADAIVTVAADTPFFPRDLVARLMAASDGQAHPLVLAATPGRGGGDEIDVPVRADPASDLWPVAGGVARRSARGVAGGAAQGGDLDGQHGGREAVFDDPGDPFFNVNTPEDLVRAQAMLEAME